MNDPGSSSAEAHACRWGANAALFAILGLVLSGPVAVILLTLVHPQPAWTDAEQFARHYHWLQSLPYFGGFLLVFGFVAMIASLYELAPAEQKARAMTAVVVTAAFAGLVSLNYVIQTTFVPNLARRYSSDSAAIITAFSMVNPSSLSWSLEMWAYGFLGIGHWLIAPVFSRTPVEKSAAILFVVNGITSSVAAVWTAIDPGWVVTSVGAIAYAAWNILALVIAAFAWVALRQRIQPQP